MNIHRKLRTTIEPVLASVYSGIRTLAQDGKAGLSVAAFLLSKINSHKGSVTIKNNNLRTTGVIY